MTSTFDSLMRDGLDASRRDDLDGALRARREATSIQPRSALPHFLMGAEYAQARRLAEAEASFANAVLLAPSLETARYQLGLLQYSSGRAAVAMVTWEPLFQLEAGHPIRSFVEGFSALAADDFETALRVFATGMEANRDNAPMNVDIAQVVAAIGQVLSAHAGQPAHGTRFGGAAGPVGSHVLLAGYRQQGPVH